MILHAAWREPDALHVWGEHDGKPRARAGVHPQAATPAEVRAALAALLPGVPAVTEPAPGILDALEVLQVPKGGRGPVPSRGGPDVRRPGPLRLGRWRVPGIRFPAGAAIGWLVALPTRGSEPAASAVGADLAWYSEAAKLVLELVARERYVATAAYAGKRGLVGRWEPVYSAPGVLERVGGLARAMPEACRAVHGTRSPRPALVRNFLRAGVDGLVRAVHIPAEPNEAVAPAASQRPAQRWLSSLGTQPGPAASGEAKSLAHMVERWVAPLLAEPAADAPRTAFRLEVPQPEDLRRWTLRFLLRPAQEPAALLPTTTLWDARAPGAPSLQPKAEERLRADLTRAGRLFPPIAEALQARRPEFVWLNVEEAHRFLAEAGPLLAEGGVPVLTPDWWGATGTRLATSGVIRPVPASSGAAGLDALVHLDLKLALGGAELTESELLRLVQLKQPLVQIRGRWVEFRTEDVEAARVLLDRRRISLTLGEALGRGLGGEAPGKLAVLDIESEGWIRQLLDSLKGTQRLEPVPVPAQFHGTLRPYQSRGLAWLDFFRRHGMHACLADDMGLGKTVQTLALLLRHADPGRAGPSLLVCPTSVIGTWAREAARFTPTLRIRVHDGPDRARGRHFANALSRCDLLVTSYALLQRDQDLLRPVRWDTVVLDEVQNIKNPDARQTRVAWSLQARHRLGLTGTPVENHLTELWSIFEFLSPGYLGTLEGFRRGYAIPIERWHSAAHAERLRRLVVPFILRRMKTDPGLVPELPPKIETREMCRLTREQGNLYAGVVRAMLGRIEQARGIQRKGLVLATLTRLKQVCDHPTLVLKDRRGLPKRSGKLARLEELLEEIMEEGQKALVFTQYAEMGTLLRRRLAERLGVEILFLHGGTPRREREAMIDRFQDPATKAAVFLLSLKAGGTGLNLTAASHVVHFDRWWNPAVEAQATDRAHRIGQARAVHVHTLVCQGTLEDRIDALLESKKKLASRIIGTGETWITELSNAQLKSVFTLGPDAVADES